MTHPRHSPTGRVRSLTGAAHQPTRSTVLCSLGSGSPSDRLCWPSCWRSSLRRLPRSAPHRRAPPRSLGDGMGAGVDDAWDVAFMPDGNALITEKSSGIVHMSAHRRLAHRDRSRPERLSSRRRGRADGPRDRPRLRPKPSLLHLPELHRERCAGCALVTQQRADSRDSPGRDRRRNRHEQRPSQRLPAAVRLRGLPVDRHGRRCSRLEPARPPVTRRQGAAGRSPDGQRPPQQSVPHNRRSDRSKIYTYGHRNPQGLDRRPCTNEMWTGEHGPSVDDEINRLVRGGNYGWNPVPGYNEHRPHDRLLVARAAKLAPDGIRDARPSP